jgi:hypothetical protein
MKKKIFYLTLAGALLMLGGCKKYLEVQPADKLVANQVYGSESAIQQALNGIYDNLASNSLYGANLSTTTIESMGQRYNTNNINYSTPAFQTYNYTDAGALVILNTIWTTMYANILQANQFIQQIDVAGQKGVISAPHLAELKGEAIGLRALMHFDLLRLFGPVYKTTPTASAIPYYTKADGTTQAILPASQVMDSVLTDLNRAKTLLVADPVTTATGANINLITSEYYSNNRNQRLNYYAVTGLLARAYLYKGDNANANAAAKLALTDINTKFPWLPVGNILGNPVPDLVFSTEVLFGLYNSNMYVNYTTYFAQPAATANTNVTTILSAFNARLQAVFENNTNDYRYSTTWTTIGTTSYFLKYQTVTDGTKPFRFLQPMVRKSELYYILAETEPVAADGINYLNTVRNNRGLTNLAATAVLATELQKEYQKEFWGEGQVYYYYKRNALASIPSGASGTANITMTSGAATNHYLVPLPLSETTPR